jgi:hypothetical protein
METACGFGCLMVVWFSLREDGGSWDKRIGGAAFIVGISFWWCSTWHARGSFGAAYIEFIVS